ncbi:SdrD B-like domain-containing protein [Thiothrix nivea]|uniref:Conserved repeat domain protein n=1 Tax=Thiothrix nivea (strain ATCC 35100 / DSM 5205 / JP2) TaxID=870187 RepID=A0A656HGW2_THINJ|nr:SdrD B-like domain-containing protein [Thiothrix nivea]EIJ36148.1 conserved repeat domain protein [Thiothrix nivea DSM 5205]
MGKADQVIHGGGGANANVPYLLQALTAMLLWVLLLWAGGVQAAPFTPSGPIAGRVYQDFDSDGTIDTSGTVIDVGVANVQVSIYDSTGALRETTTTDANGDYTFTVASLDGVQGPYRVEFSSLPSGYGSGQNGTQSGTSVQFINADTAAARTANLALLVPCEYCQANPTMAVVYQADSTSDSALKTVNTQLLFDPTYFTYDTTNRVPTDQVATFAELGSLFGLAYRNQSGDLFAGAFAKRNGIGFGAGGADAVYRIPVNGGTPQLFFNLANLTGGASAGSSAAIDSDSEAQSQVGFSGLGDLELSLDQQTLYLVNLANRNLYAVPLNTATTPITHTGSTTGYAIPVPATCTGGSGAQGLSALGLGVHPRTGKVYVGLTCTGYTAATYSNSALRAYVYEFDPAASAFNTTPVIDQPLTYARDTSERNQTWNNWSTVISPLNFSTFKHPWLSDIEFVGADMVLGFRARSGDMIEDSSGTQGGETLYACANGSGGWTVEASGGCEGRSSVVGATNLRGNAPNLQGPGTPQGEWYWDDDGREGEAANGALAQLPGGPLFSTQIDGLGRNYRMGFYAFNNVTGQVIGGANTTYLGANFGKANNFGDIELLCDPAPIEIGNRVWDDTDGDGIQDAGEAGIDGVDVTLTCGSDVATAATANGGQYLFSSASNAAFLSSGKTCTVVVASSGQPELDGLEVTAQNADGATDNNATTDLRDSDASAAGQIVVAVGGAGENNHTLDFGYREQAVAVDIELGKVADKANARRGDTVVYTLTASNTSTTNATGVQVTDVLPAGVTLATGTPPVASQGTYNTATGVWDIGNLDAGQPPVTLTITVTVD